LGRHQITVCEDCEFCQARPESSCSPTETSLQSSVTILLRTAAATMLIFSCKGKASDIQHAFPVIFGTDCRVARAYGRAIEQQEHGALVWIVAGDRP